MSKNFNTDNNIKAMETINTANKEERTMSNNVNNATINTENKEESIMSNNVNNATINTENKEESIMSNNVNEATVNTENKEERAMSNSNENKIKEETTMTNNQTNNEKVELATETTQFDNREERGETSIQEVKTAENNIVLSPKSMGLLADSIDECDRAVKITSNDRDKKLKAMWSKVAVSSYLEGMQNVTNVLDDKIYASLYENEKGERQINYCQKYNDGSFSPKMSVSQADMIMAILARESQSDNPNKKAQRLSDNFFIKVGKDYLGKFRGTPREALNIEKVMNALYGVLPFLSVSKSNLFEWNREEFYNKFIPNVKMLGIQMINKHKSYFIFSKAELESLAQDMKLTPLKLLQQLKEYGLLYLTESSRGYQTNVRFTRADGSTYTAWMYCVYNLEYLAGVDGDGEDGEDGEVLALDEF